MIARRLGPDHGAPDAFFGAAFELFGAGLNIFERNQTQRQEALRIVAAIFGGPVVIGRETGGPQLDIVEHIQRHAHRGVDRLGDHAVPVLILNPGGRVPDRSRSLVHAFFVVLGQVGRRHASAKEGCDREGRDVFAHKILARFAVQIFDGVGRLIPELLVQAFLPHAGRFDKMRIRGNNTVVCHTRPSFRLCFLFV